MKDRIVLITKDATCKSYLSVYGNKYVKMPNLEAIAKSDDVVMIHWSASPFITEEMISDNIRVCKEKGNAITACLFLPSLWHQ